MTSHRTAKAFLIKSLHYRLAMPTRFTMQRTFLRWTLSLVAVAIVALTLILWLHQRGIKNHDPKRGVDVDAASVAPRQPNATVGDKANVGKQGAPARTAPIGWIDEPAADTIVGLDVTIAGWALDAAGIERVEIRAGKTAYPTQFGLPRPDVSVTKTGFPDSAAAGFRFRGDLAALAGASPNERRVVDVVAISKSGAETVLGRKHLLLPTESSEWRSLYASHGPSSADVFYIVPGLSAIQLGGGRDLDTAYTHYLSPTVRVGMRVPILYMRTTHGASQDWRFDADWDYERRCGERRIAEDSLNAVIRHARQFRLPILFTLNGGVWSDASCNVPQWDVTDHLEQDKVNVQWNERNEALPDNYLKNLPGAQDSPELARMLTYNVFATRNRHYKRRNLQAAGRIIAQFARTDPELFIGINLDPDTVHNPFFEEQQWYDYNRDTIRQFRRWLAGTGPYEGRGGLGVPDLSRYRRAVPLRLAEVNRLSKRDFKHWNEVDPPRSFPRETNPFWNDPWTHEWEVFRRHLIDLHYDELSQWLTQVDIPSHRIFSSQGFMAPHDAAMPFAVRVESPSKNYDTGGISVEGAIPSNGHLGAVVYGPAARNEIRMETQDSLFATFHRMDPGWGIMEFNTADLRAPTQLPTYEMAYKAFRDAFNFGARLVSPMAWGGSDGLQAGQPGYVSYMAWRNTPLEEAMRDFAVSHAYVPRGTRLWTFGSGSLASDDGWSAADGVTVRAHNGHLELRATGGDIALVSPPNLAIRRGEVGLLVVGLDRPELVASISVEFRNVTNSWISAGTLDRDALTKNTAGLLLPVEWPDSLGEAEQVRVVLRLSGDSHTEKSLSLRHIALYRGAIRSPQR